MWDKLKQIAQMQGMKKQIEKEIVTKEEQGIRIKINGALEVLEIFIDDNVTMENKKIAYLIKNLLNKGIKEVNELSAKKMMEMMK